MTNTERYDEAMKLVFDVDKKADSLKLLAERVNQTALNTIGIVYVSREPGFPCWTHAELSEYFNTPREVAEALDRREKP